MNLKKQLVKLTRKNREVQPMWFGHKKPVHLDTVNVDALDYFNQSSYSSESISVKVFLEKF